MLTINSCSTNILTAEVVEVNETTLELGCVKTRRFPTVLNTRFTEILEIHGCKKGSKKEQRICDQKTVVSHLKNQKSRTLSENCKF